MLPIRENACPIQIGKKEAAQRRPGAWDGAASITSSPHHAHLHIIKTPRVHVFYYPKLLDLIT
jgi:hypothetical protein